ncbi:Putative ribonuclease H protein At1g65750, partial [Linum perenne]
AFVSNFGACSITREEIRVALRGLLFAWDSRARRVMLQMDSQAVVLQLRGEIENQFVAEILAFREIISRDWEVVTRHVYREANRAADFLANRGHSFALGTHEFSVSNASFGHVLLSDILGISTPHFILSIN